MPSFRHIFKDLELYLAEQRALENDPDYQVALREVDEFLVPSSIGRDINGPMDKLATSSPSQGGDSGFKPQWG